ncbi:MAG TPA: GMC family oxidoreductase, partial [Bryobacteraceae bacterium]|nr:GMC family oxidoreductase [Bryobacteraceae bacterium]
VLTARICIIGSGMGGATLAEQLADASQDVLLVEAGKVDAPRPSSNGSANVCAESDGRPFGLPFTRSIELGGTSNWWHGGWGRLDRVDFEHRPWINASGWPIRYDDLAHYYSEVALQVGLYASDLDQQEVERRFPGRLNDIDFNRTVLKPKTLEIQRKPVRWKKIILNLARATRLRCLINASALEVIVTPGGHVSELVVGLPVGTARVRAGIFVICAGALETPRLLLNSRSTMPCGIGNTHDLVGRYLLDHPMGHYSKVRFNPPIKAQVYSDAPLGPSTRIRVGLRLACEQQRACEIPNHYLWLRPSITSTRVDDDVLLSFLATQSFTDVTSGQIKAMLTTPDILYRVLIYRLGLNATYHYGDLFFTTEQIPNRNSRVRLSHSEKDRHGYPIACIGWQLGDEDYRAFERYTRLLFSDALRSEQYAMVEQDPRNECLQTFRSSAHHLGTARMARSPKEGVVDKNLRVFGTDNLFVCDGSVFPTAGGVNPAFTIMALSRRLGHHLLSSR